MISRIDNNRGSALLISLALMVLITLMAVMSADRATQDIDMSINESDYQQAFYVADAGMKHAVLILNDTITWRTGFTNQIFADGSYSVAVIDSSTQAGLADTVRIISTGIAKDATAGVEAIVVPARNKPFRYAMFAASKLEMEKFSCTNSFNSDSGTYAATMLDSLGTIGTNGQMKLEGSVVVNGNVVVGAGGTSNIDPSVIVNGNVLTGQPPVVIDTVPTSAFNNAIANNSAPSGFSGTGYSYSAGILKIDTSGSVTLAGGTYYFQQIDLQNFGAINIAPGAKVTIYMNGTLNMEGNTSMNAGGLPKNLAVISRAPGDGFKLQNSAQFWGTYFGPGNEFEMEDNSAVYGSVIANKTESEILGGLGSSGCLHFDRSLLNYGFGSISGMKLVAWKEQ